MNVMKGKLLETIPKWGKVYTVEADITVTKRPSNLSGTQNNISIFNFRPSGFWSNFEADYNSISIKSHL